MVRRDRAYLQWRYRDNPFHNYHLVGLYWLGQLRGWAVYSVNEGKYFIVDMLVRHTLARKMLSLLSQYLRKDGAEEVLSWIPKPLRKHVTGLTSIPSGIVPTNVVWKTPMDTETVRNHLYYTMGDNDIF